MQDLIEDDPQRPYIDCIGVIMKLSLFRCDVFLSSSDSLHDDLLSTESKISQFNDRHVLARCVLGLEKDVLWL